MLIYQLISNDRGRNFGTVIQLYGQEDLISNNVEILYTVKYALLDGTAALWSPDPNSRSNYFQ